MIESLDKLFSYLDIFKFMIWKVLVEIAFTLKNSFNTIFIIYDEMDLCSEIIDFGI